MTQLARSMASLLSIALVHCGGAADFHPEFPGNPGNGSPLGSSYTLIPVPHNDATLLGRMLVDVPDEGQSLDGASQPNDCERHLAPVVSGPMADEFEDTIQLSHGAHAQAALHLFEFALKSESATHISYKLHVKQRIARRDTREYLACCRENPDACGYGYVSELLYGEGEYRAVKETTDVDASIALPIASVGGFMRGKVVKSRRVDGYVAALVKTQSQKSKLGVLGNPEALGYVAPTSTLSTQVRDRYQRARVEIVPVQAERYDRSGADYAYVFRDGLGNITENNFIDRYSEVVGPSELDRARTTRRSELILIGSIALAVGAASTALGVQWANNGGVDASNTCDAKTCIALYGGLLTALLGAGDLVIALAWFDRDPVKHAIDRPDAELFADRYNDVLLEKTIKRTQERWKKIRAPSDDAERSSRGSVRLLLGLGSVGVSGTF